MQSDPTPAALSRTVAPPGGPILSASYDRAINYAFQQNAIPVVKELGIRNDGAARKDLTLRVSTEPAFAAPVELHLQGLSAGEEFRIAPLDLKLSPAFLGELTEKVTGWLHIELLEAGIVISRKSEPITLLARNEWCGLAALPEILAAFVLPNDPAVMELLAAASRILGEHTGRSALNGYQDKSRKRAWDQVAAIYKAVAEAGLRYIAPPASFENTGQKVRFPSDMIGQRFGTCLDLVLLFAACCEQAGLHPLILMHQGHAYAGCWLEERTLEEAAIDDLQRVRKLVELEAITVFETTILTESSPGTLRDGERAAQPHLETDVPFRLALDIRRARVSRIHPLPVSGGAVAQERIAQGGAAPSAPVDGGLGAREFADPFIVQPAPPQRVISRIDQWKSRLLDLSLRNRLLNFKPTKGTIPILSVAPEQVEDELAANAELSVQPKPKMMGEEDPRDPAIYTQQQKADWLAGYLKDELEHGRLRSGLDEAEHARRLTELYRAARLSLEENGANTLFAAVGVLEWRETEHSDRVLRAPLLLVPVELKRRSILEGFVLRRLDEETRLNVTLMEMLRQQFQKEIPGLDPLPEDEKGVHVNQVFQLFREAVRDLPGWEVKAEIWLGQFSFSKFLLWKDLTDRLEVLTQNRIVRHLVHESGLPYPNPPEDIHPPQLDDQFHPRDVVCPRSADSSQLAAVMAAAAGHDFVLEGPPGTGKSQTITNIIAHCLAHGKRVLFVAEKRAALDVVHRRLKEEGLEPFCLELHSNKSGKGHVLAQFDQALKFVADSGGSQWERKAVELEKLRASLNGYARALHRRYPCGLSAYDCFDYLVPRQADEIVRLETWPNITQSSSESLAAARAAVHSLQERSRQLGNMAGHPLSLLECEEWSPTWAERALEHLQVLSKPLETAAAAVRDFCGWLGWKSPELSWTQLQQFENLAESLIEPEPVGPAFATTPWARLGADLDAWIALAQERKELRLRLEGLFQQPPLPLSGDGWSDSAAEQIADRARQLKSLIAPTAHAAGELRRWLLRPGPAASRAELNRLLALASSLLAAEPVGPGFATTPWAELAAHLDEWIALIEERTELRTKLTAYDEPKLLALDLSHLRQEWEAGQSAWFLVKWWKSEQVRRQLRGTRSDSTSPHHEEVSPALANALRLREINRVFAQHSSLLKSCLGALSNEGHLSAESLKRVRAWGARLHAEIGDCAGKDTAWRDEFQKLLSGLFEAGKAAYAPGTEAGSWLSGYREAFSNFDAAYRAFAGEFSLKRDPMDSAEDHLATVDSTLSSLMADLPRLGVLNAALGRAAANAQEALGVLWANGEPDPEVLLRVRTWGEALHSRMAACAGEDFEWLGRFRQLLSSLFAEGPPVYAEGTVIGQRLHHFRASCAAFEAAFASFAAEVRLKRDSLETAPDHFGEIRRTLSGIQKAWPQLRLWCSWRRARREGQELWLAPIVARIESSSAPLADLPELFERSFRRSLLYSIIEQEKILREFFGHEHLDQIARFRKADERHAALTRDLIRARLSAKIPRDQPEADVPKAELGLLRKEIGKKARHIPVRQLLSRIPQLLPCLKPCVLMSPLSVAQYLGASHQAFDVVIFDEASQIPVWDSVGAIARGQQLIVVGDPKQLPPTNFFNRTDEADDEALVEHEDLESILDELLTHGLRHKRLQWHYRSRHEGLIAFSNRHYYDNHLLTFPSPETRLGGVRFVHLPEARYDKGKSRTNVGEARALVTALVGWLSDAAGPPRSFGVVTFSQAQQQLIENLLDEERRKHPEIEVHFGDAPPVEGEPVFVKNLESVQGDERDVILFSICYGPDETGSISLNFGPLNREGGERRLNVAITRAKHEVVVFSGLRGDQVDLTRTRARGVRDLKYFLEYAEGGPPALVATTETVKLTDAESELQHWIAAAIRDAGYQVHHQIGCSGYRIDLGVVDPAQPGRYLLGIECDGATYDRAATARDRDKLRQLVLEGLGWSLYRIWSTDWWHDRETQMTRLMEVLTNLKQPSHKKPAKK